MTTTVVLGAQWGDEGKGKVTDFFASSADYVVRFQGGNNAGHTIVVGDEKLALSLTPSGVLYPDCVPVIGSGCVIDLGFLKEELEMLNSKNVSTKKLAISPNAHVIMPYHKLLDELIEESLGDKKIGTTKKGIGPCYADKIQRSGIRIQDLLDDEVFAEKVKINVEEKNQLLTKIYGRDALDPYEIINEFKAYKEIINNHIKDTSLMISNAIKQDKNILFEGAQGTLLDIDHGTYPFVTSSNTHAGQASAGSGVGANKLGFILGITKAYTTRVGSGPFPTELFDEVGKGLAKRGHEFGTVTERPRRCGWFDAVLVRQVNKTMGVSGMALMKLDVLDSIKELKICVGYDIDGKEYDHYPASTELQAKAKPIYETMPGWSEDTYGCRDKSKLPKNAIAYINRIEQLVETPVAVLSTSPERDDTILIQDPFNK